MLALEGIKILDLSNYVPGALCTMILADFGAEVIKVEPAKAFPMGDMGYSPGGKDKEREAAYFALNRNKKCIGLNLRSDEGRRIFHRMAKEADVVIEATGPVSWNLASIKDGERNQPPHRLLLSLGLRPGRALPPVLGS
jgi:formyl-CoA transferase